MKPDVLVRLTNQLNTMAPEFEQFRYASPQKSDDAMTAIYGTPLFEQRLKMAGAFPATASEYKDLDDIYKKEFPEDHADVITAAFTTLPKLLIPALSIPMTNADPAAPTPPFVRRESS